ncbi:hypothetical protein ON010_g11595 [Phytophthora cinnamomi]|nr:hypothetical protein ON010_g11595 [Phytophthora cinnamomi]
MANHPYSQFISHFVFRFLVIVVERVIGVDGTQQILGPRSDAAHQACPGFLVFVVSPKSIVPFPLQSVVGHLAPVTDVVDADTQREAEIGQAAFPPVDGVHEQPTGLLEAVGQENQRERQEGQQYEGPHGEVRVHAGAGQEDGEEDLHEERDAEHEDAHEHQEGEVAQPELAQRAVQPPLAFLARQLLQLGAPPLLRRHAVVAARLGLGAVHRSPRR